MQIVISRKHLSHNAEQAFDLKALAMSMATASSSTNTRTFTDPEAAKTYVESQTRAGLVCHVFDYTKSFAAKTTLSAVKAA